MLYDPSLSAPKNMEKMKQNGIDISESTVRNWSKDYTSPSLPFNQPEYQAPRCDGFNPIKVQIPSSLTKFGWGDAENDLNNNKPWNNQWASGSENDIGW